MKDLMNYSCLLGKFFLWLSERIPGIWSWVSGCIKTTTATNNLNKHLQFQLQHFLQTPGKVSDINYLTKVVFISRTEFMLCSTKSVVHSYLRARKLYTLYSVDCIYVSSQTITFFLHMQLGIFHDMGINCVAWNHMTECDSVDNTVYKRSYSQGFGLQPQ